jgi:hypothetical protein
MSPRRARSLRTPRIATTTTITVMTIMKMTIVNTGMITTIPFIDPDLKNPQTAHWQRSFQIFDLLL